jgi:hypothetical protein
VNGSAVVAPVKQEATKGQIVLPPTSLAYQVYFHLYVLRRYSMGQVTIYLDADSEKRLKEAAAVAGMSVSRWVAHLIEERTRTQWPHAVREAAGAWRTFPDREEIAPLGEDIPREPL